MDNFAIFAEMVKFDILTYLPLFRGVKYGKIWYFDIFAIIWGGAKLGGWENMGGQMA